MKSTLTFLVFSFFISFSAFSQNPTWSAHTANEYGWELVFNGENEAWYVARGGVWRIDLITGETVGFQTYNSNLQSLDIRGAEIDSLGNIWITEVLEDVLYKFDGSDWQVIEQNEDKDYEQNLRALPDNKMAVYVKDNETTNVDLVSYNQNGEAEVLIENIIEDLGNSTFSFGNSLFTSTGEFWYKISNTEMKRRLPDGSLITYNSANSPISQTGYARSIVEDSEGNIWVLFSGGDFGNIISWHIYNPQTDSWSSHFPDDFLPSSTVFSILGTNHGIIRDGEDMYVNFNETGYIKYNSDEGWIVGENPKPDDVYVYSSMNIRDGIFYYTGVKNDERYGILESSEAETRFIPIGDTHWDCNFRVDDIYVDYQCNMWQLNEFSDMTDLDLDWNEFKSVFDNYFTNNDIPEVRGLHITEEGVWYVSLESEELFWTYALLSSTDGVNWTEESVPEFPDDPNDFSDLEQAPDGSMWGVDGRFVYHKVGNQWEKVSYWDGNWDHNIYGITITEIGEIWGTDYYNTFYKYNLASNVMEIITIPFQPASTGNVITAKPKEDREGNLVFTFNGNIVIYQNGIYTNAPIPEEVYEEYSYTVGTMVDENNNYWVAGYDRLFKFDGVEWQAFEGGWYRDFANSMMQDTSNNIYISFGTHSGVIIFNENGIDKRHDFCLEGKSYYDVSGDTGYDFGDVPLNGMPVFIEPDSVTIFSSYFGDYNFGYYDETTRTATSIHDEGEWNLVSDSMSYSISPTLDSCNTENDFGFVSLNPPADMADVFLMPPFSRCFETQAMPVRVFNSNFLPGDFLLKVALSESIIVESFDTEPDYYLGDTMVWENIALAAYGYFDNLISITFPDETQTGEPIVFYASVASQSFPDLLLDEENWDGEIFCAYDPNDIAVNSPGIYSEDNRYCYPNYPLDYLIRFENEGNDTAFQIEVTNTLDFDFDVNSFEILHSSHPCVTTLEANRKLTFDFQDIHLPPSEQDPDGGHGFVRYRISPRANLPEPTLISNQALIYFDFNAPVITNIVETIIQTPQSVAVKDLFSFTTDLENVFVYPNPVSQLLQIEFLKDLSSEEPVYSVVTPQGKIVFTKKLSNNDQLQSVNLSALPEGMYFHTIKSQERILFADKLRIMR